MTKALITKLKGCLPKGAVLDLPEQLHPFECDGLSAYRETPLAVVLPETTAQVQTVMKLCHRADVPVVARGAGTGLSGGALPHAKGILLSLSKLNRILSIDADNTTARVQPGVRNLAISEAAAAYGLYYAPDPSSQIACTIGGNIAENSGGVHCLKYGLTVHNVMEITFIASDGEQLTLGSSCLDSSGYDLLAAMIGSEGLLGVVVEAVVKLLPQPPSSTLIMASFDEVAIAGEAVNTLISAGLIPAGLEMMDNLSIQAAEDFIHAGYPKSAAAILLCELDGIASEVDAETERATQLLSQAGAKQMVQAKNAEEKNRLWAGRKNAFPAVGRISPDYYCMDGTIPRAQLAFVLNRIAEMSAETGLRVANVFHAGDGNLHPLILFDANVPGELEKAETLGGRILELCVDVGGTITGEHGVGMEKINQMCVQFNERELEQFHRLKAAFDPAGILNPDKAIPTLHRCAEFGAMHVHHGQIPFPDLPRF
ncbi:MAG TPA: FAD-binding oxidoreductase [Gammaproteobacteria bacterium]|nr:FAD-binding oxidoreductase [Gammaproteobacteria bacterium]